MIRQRILILCTFAVTGLLITQIAPFVLRQIIGLEGGVIKGPWKYRICYLLIIPPLYYMILIIVGTIFGQGEYFRNRLKSIFKKLFFFISRG